MGSLFSSCFPVHRSSDSTHTDRGVDLSTVDRASPAAAEKRQRIAQATEERLKQVCAYGVLYFCTNHKSQQRGLRKDKLGPSKSPSS